MPVPPESLKVRSVLEVQIEGQRGLVGLPNMIFRTGPSPDEASESAGADVIERSSPPA